MRGINSVFISGNVTGSKIDFQDLNKGGEACSFELVSHRHALGDSQVRAYVKVNVYTGGLVRACRTRLDKGVYVIVRGELMNREGKHGELTEVRALDLIFFPKKEEN